MKCPHCGKWNSASLPHCIYCGEALPDDAYGKDGVPVWQMELDDRSGEKSYIHVDDSGEAETTVDPRERLAREMADLKTRKIRGEEKQRMLRQEAARRGMAPSGRTVRTTSNRSTFFSAYDDPSATLRPVAPEMVEQGDVRPGARRVVPSQYRYTDPGTDEAFSPGETRRLVDIKLPDESENVYDGFQDAGAYMGVDGSDPENAMRMHSSSYARIRRPRRHSARRALHVLVVLALVAAVGWAAYAYVFPLLWPQEEEQALKATVIPTIRQDVAAHTITIPGEEGQRITIRELRTSAIVTGGVATFDILDHIWYDEYEDYLQDTMTVTLTPYVTSDSGKQTPLGAISYEIDIPLSPIEINTPDNLYQEVSTAMYDISFSVTVGSSVFINGEDCSDLVDSEDGSVNYNATVQPIGENNYTIEVQSQYCRANSITVTLYRARQSIPLDLASETSSTSTSGDGTMTIRGTTLPGAVIKVLSPYSDLDITNTDTDGSFSFIAKFDKIGNNTVVITADYPRRETTRVEHVVYYVPNIDVYSRKAWDINKDYTSLMDNLETRVRNSQIYVCKGTVTSVETTKPQRAFFDVSLTDSPLLIYVENASKTTWEVGKSYDLYADVFGLYDSKPWLIVRYTYPYTGS